MIALLVRRLGLLLLVVFGVSTVLFVLTRLSGDPAALLSPPDAGPEVLEATRTRLGLDDPLWLQYVHTLVSTFTFDFGQSFAMDAPVNSLLWSRLATSLWIIVPALVIGPLISLVIGLYAALHPTRPGGRLVMGAAFLTDGVPYFLLAFVLILVFALQLGWLPATGNVGYAALAIPVTVLTVSAVSATSRLVRGQMLDALAQGPVLTARSLGLSPAVVLFRHALPIAVPPLLAWLGIQFSFLFSALLVLEPIMNFGGIGNLLVRSVNSRDFPVVQACIVVFAVLITAVNIALDLAVRGIDPRLRKGTA
ncbi:ABC transporter permease [Kineosporia sp. NBRC 101731]|uniref:ABC transporter permease n=1 Tax=Kineosporia sp. NBRC 101731 TaxID=3032199 RepID=UPI0024A50038|nr:ABC transporter permease [Kineosporia sp. NBRC 101731]GLY29637.1 glutathione ABC transporter permease [Kineosporia sp. NBRC 101731]